MAKKFFITTAWLLTAAGTFALGWALKPSEPNTNRTPQATATAPVTPAGRNRSDAAIGMVKQEAGLLGAYIKNGKISAADMKVAMKAVVDEDDPLKRARLFSALLDELTPENAKAAFESLQESQRGGRGGFGPGGPRRGGMNETALLLNAWGRIDGAGAIAELTAMREARAAEGEEGSDAGRGGRGRGGRGGFGGDGVMDFMSALSGWATTDADAASAYVTGLEDEREQRMYTASILQGVLLNGVDEAMKFVSSLPDENTSGERYMTMIASEVLEDGVEAAKQWVDTIDDDNLKGGALMRVAGEYVRDDLEGAIDWVTRYADEDYAAEAVNQVASRWAESDPQAALEWASELPGASQAGAFEEALDQWTERDAVGASEYLAQMPPSSAKDSAVQGFATELARDDPQSAILWAGTIGDDQLRMETLTAVAQSYMRTDRTAAQAWLETSGLPAETQQVIIESSQGRGFGGRGDFGGGPGGRRFR